MNHRETTASALARELQRPVHTARRAHFNGGQVVLKAKSWFKWASTAALLATATSACSGGMGELGDEGDGYADDGEVGTLEQGWGYYYQPPPPSYPSYPTYPTYPSPTPTPSTSLMNCSNPDGTNSTMAALAVAAAKELGRWQTSKDFVVVQRGTYSPTSQGSSETLELASGTDSSGQPIGRSRCGGTCTNVEALLALQYDNAANQVWLQGSGSTKVLVNPGALRSRMAAKWKEQKSCDGSAQDGVSTACPREEHALTFLSSSTGSCDTNFYFQAKKTNGSTLAYTNQLKHKLRFADSSNPYVDFKDLGGGKVSIDPTYGLNESGTTSSGTCYAACTRITASNVAGQCCTCGGTNRSFARATFNASTYLCK